MSGRREFEAPYDGTLWLFINAGGGWDPTSLCDPKGADYEDQPDRMNNYLAADIEEAGNIRYAPVAGNAAFFQKYYQQTMILNGLDMKTNGHDAGNRHMWSGRLSEGHPTLPAFIAGAFSPAQPMSFLSYGGYSDTAGMVAKTQLGALGPLLNLAYPDRFNGQDEMSPTFHSAQTEELIYQAHLEREEAMLNAQMLPRIKQSMSTLFTSRSGSSELKLLQQYLPETLSDNQVGQQGQVAVAAYKAGICVSSMLSTGGFDTHGDHDNNHFPRLQTITEGIDAILTFAEQLDVLDKVFICVGSDFGRTPGYNDGMGKDHWPITSMMFMGAGVPGNTVIGETTERHEAKGVDLATLQVDNSGGGTNIEPGNVIASIRQLAGLGQSEFTAMFPVDKEPLPLFG